MIYTPLTHLAMKIAYSAHHGQFDKGGAPYIFHPFHLAEQMDDEISVCAALLHDVIEDTDLTAEELSQMGIPDEVIDVVKILTHDNAVPYLDYIRQIKSSGSKTAVKIKLADLYHNSDPTRAVAPNPERMARYKEAVRILKE